MKIKVLHFGKLPPPIGGVTIHISRLLFQANKQEGFKNEILDYSKEKNFYYVSKKVFSTRLIHIHLSNRKLRFFCTLLFRLLFKKVVITFHGKYDFENIFDTWALKISSASILLNNFSYSKAETIKKKGIYKIGAFINPIEDELTPLKAKDVQNINILKAKYKKVFCTNATSLAFDERGREIYMGTDIISYFQNKKDIALVFSCPNDDYFNFLKEKFNTFSKNIFFIIVKHDFVNVIRSTDALIRATTIDGDSLSVKEAMFYHKQVFATSIVDRPKGVILFSDFSDFDKKYNCSDISLENVEDNSAKIFNLYNSLLK